jgi:hypothetical protein
MTKWVDVKIRKELAGCLTQILPVYTSKCGGHP